MRCTTSLRAVVALWALTAAGRPADLDATCRKYSRFDLDGDGDPEIVAMSRIRLGDEISGNGSKSVLLLVEKRLWSEPAGLRPSILRYAQDLSADGYGVLSAAVELYSGPAHRDGRILLALRRFVQEVFRGTGGLKGCVLVGNFPDALIVRQYFWKKHGKVVLHRKTPKEQTFEKVHYWACIPEDVAKMADVVLGDMDGKWEDVYHEQPVELPQFVAVFPNGTGDDAKGVTERFEMATRKCHDFFFVHDGRWRSEAVESGGRRFVRTGPRNDECSEEDKKRPNPMAVPEIFVGRINAKHIGIKPKASIRDKDGRGLVDREGNPLTLTFSKPDDVPHPRETWERCEKMERQLLTEYFARNHAYRQGDFANASLPAAISTHNHATIAGITKHFPEWADLAIEGHDVHGSQADLLACIQWLKRPALLRTIWAHSDPWGANFAKTKDTAALVREMGGRVFGWYKDGAKLVCGFKGPQGKIDFPIFRSLYENGILPNSPSMFLHFGCDAMTPGGYLDRSYTHPQYAKWQHVEGLLFYCNGLVVLGRAKVFNDCPREVYQTLAAGKCWGEAWTRYFEIEAGDERLDTDQQGIRRKKAYFWSLAGDPTLKLLSSR